jgi:hypothetical protein
MLNFSPYFRAGFMVYIITLVHRPELTVSLSPQTRFVSIMRHPAVCTH